MFTIGGQECEESFQRLKELLQEETTMTSYDPARDTRMYVDHGPKGVGATVAQNYGSGGGEGGRLCTTAGP